MKNCVSLCLFTNLRNLPQDIPRVTSTSKETEKVGLMSIKADGIFLAMCNLAVLKLNLSSANSNTKLNGEIVLFLKDRS